MENKKYTGAMLHGCYKPNQNASGKHGSINLGYTPEDVLEEKVAPLMHQLNDILKEHNVYLWMTTGYVIDKDEEDDKRWV